MAEPSRVAALRDGEERSGARRAGGSSRVVFRVGDDLACFRTSSGGTLFPLTQLGGLADVRTAPALADALDTGLRTREKRPAARS